MFLFLFSWALPLSFVPIVAAALPKYFDTVRPEMASALPISAEMLCALATAALSGWLSDRVGWHVPTLAGFALSAVAAIVSGTSTNFEMFVVGRALTGLGYGLSWMGIQALVVRNAPQDTVTFGIANMTAGIFTGHMLGSFAGGWFSEIAGYSGVFFLMALVLIIPFLYAIIVLKPYFFAPERVTANRIASATSVSLFRNVSFLSLLIASIIPFSIAQVGFLYYALPLYLHANGAPNSIIGAILALYSVIFVFSAPAIAKLADRYAAKKLFVLAGGIIGSAALMVLFALPNIAGVVVTTVALAVASSIGGAAQTSYAMQIDVVRRAGAGLATGIQRAADKLGQMMGPLIVGGLYAQHGLVNAVALTGVLYLVAIGCFAFAARRYTS
jgi:predicted MFS family arabinose efflux permease